MEALALEFVGGIISQLGTSNGPFLQFMCCFGDEKKKLQSRLTAVKARLLEAEVHDEKMSLLGKDWIEKLQLILYEADDLVDEIRLYENADFQTANILCRFFKTTIPYHIRMPFKLKAIRERLADFAVERAQLPPPPQRPWTDRDGNKVPRDEPQSYTPSADIVGREKDKEVIKNMIKQCSSSISATNNVPTVIAIIGMGGLGKTTIARWVHDDAEAFDLKIWVWVSPDFNVQNLLTKIIHTATKVKCELTEMIQLESKLRECLDGKKYLLVLDDMWIDNHISWKDLEKLLKGGAKGSVILATTRERGVALTIGAAPECQYSLKDLGKEDDLQSFTRLCTLDLCSLPKLTSLPKGLQYATTLKELSIYDCDGLVDLAEEDDLQSFTGLCKIFLRNLLKLMSLPKGLQYASNLKELTILKCDGLVSWLDSMGNITSLHSLHIRALQTLTSLPQALRHLTTLETLEIGNCPELNFSDGDTPFPTNLHVLTLDGLPKLTFLRDSLKVLTSLQDLRIYNCEELKSLPETMSCLTALHGLHILNCPQLPKIHQRAPNIAHIPEIWIDDKYL